VLKLCDISFEEAKRFVMENHRHHKKIVGHKFSLAVTDGVRVRGVAIVGRPVARHADNGSTLEVNRLCTDGARNACSMLYAAAWRKAKAMGFTRLITYTLPEEGGASLRAAGWRLLGRTKGGSWSRKNRPRVDAHPLQQKLRWEAV